MQVHFQMWVLSYIHDLGTLVILGLSYQSLSYIQDWKRLSIKVEVAVVLFVVIKVLNLVEFFLSKVGADVYKFLHAGFA